MIGLLLTGLAYAAAVNAQIGATTALNDPFLVRRGLKLGVAFSPDPVFAIQGDLAWYPNLGERDYKAVTDQLIHENNISPDISRMIGSGAALLAYYPFRAERDHWSSRVGFHGGFGVVYTVDDLEALQTDSADPVYAATEAQLHGTVNTGLTGDFHRDAVGLYMSMNRISYIETVGSTTLEMKSNMMFSLGISLHFSSP